MNRAAGADEERRSVQRHFRAESVADRGLRPDDLCGFRPVRAVLAIHVDDAWPELIGGFRGEDLTIADENAHGELRRVEVYPGKGKRQRERRAAKDESNRGPHAGSLCNVKGQSSTEPESNARV